MKRFALKNCKPFILPILIDDTYPLCYNNFMKWYKNLYVGETALKDRRSIIKNIKKNKFQLGAYVLTLPEGKESIMDIYPAFVLLQPNLNTRDIHIIGIANGREEAFEVFEKIVMEIYEKTGSFQLNDVLKEFK